MTIQEFMEKHGIKDSFIVYAIALALRQLNDEEEPEIKEELLNKFGINEEALEELIEAVDSISWKY